MLIATRKSVASPGISIFRFWEGNANTFGIFSLNLQNFPIHFPISGGEHFSVPPPPDATENHLNFKINAIKYKNSYIVNSIRKKIAFKQFILLIYFNFQ